MDPMLLHLLQMYQGGHNGQMPGQPGGMFGGQQPTPMTQAPTMGQPPQLPPMGAAQPADPNAQPQHHHGFNPLMLLSPMGGLMASNPKLGMSLMSPAFGLANLLGAFK